MVQFIIETYQLPPPDLILSIQTDSVNIEKRIDIAKQVGTENQVGIENQVNKTVVNQEEIKRAIRRGLAETAKITSIQFWES